MKKFFERLRYLDTLQWRADMIKREYLYMGGKLCPVNFSITLLRHIEAANKFNENKFWFMRKIKNINDSEQV